VVVVALLGLPAGWIWRLISSREHYVKYNGHLVPDDVKTFGIDGRFAVIAVVLGVVCGVVAYLLAGRFEAITLAVSVVLGGVLGSLLAWQVGNRSGRAALETAFHKATDGASLTGPPDLQARGVLLIWPLVAAIMFVILEALDVANRAPEKRSGPAGDVSGDGGGEGDEVGGRQLDLQPSPPRGDVDGGKS